MVYVMSDLHGSYEKYMKMLEKINFGKNDTLYILGDVVDRGEKSMDILFDMMARQNVKPLFGNHEYMAYSVLKNLTKELTEENYEELVTGYQNWMLNGGISTLKEFQKLSAGEKEDILEYISNFELYKEINIGGNNFVLVHAGLGNFSPDKSLDDYDLHDIIWERCDYDKVYYKDKYLVTGHTPTFYIGDEHKGKIYRKNNHIAIDCGAAFENSLGAICLDTFEEFYVD